MFFMFIVKYSIDELLNFHLQVSGVGSRSKVAEKYAGQCQQKPCKLADKELIHGGCCSAILCMLSL